MNATNLELMSSISLAMTNAPFYAMLTEKEVSALAKAGFVIQNSDIANGKKLATKLTDEGISFIDNAANLANPEETGNIEMKTETTPVTPKPKREAPLITMMAIEALPERSRKSFVKKSIYPFAEMFVGGSFIVAASETRPNPVRSLQTTVSAANKRFAPANFFITAVGNDARIWRAEDKAPKEQASAAG